MSKITANLFSLPVYAIALISNKGGKIFMHTGGYGEVMQFKRRKDAEDFIEKNEYEFSRIDSDYRISVVEMREV